MKNKLRLLLFTFVLVNVNVSFAQTALIKTEALTPHRLETMEFTTNSVSTGLNVVPNQTYVYLSAWNIGNDEPISSATFTLISKPASSTADLEVINPTWAQFKPDVLGTYEVRLSLTTVSGTHDTTTKIYSSEFVGVGNFDGTSATFPQCMACHASDQKFAEIYDRWEVSGHATKFKRDIDNPNGHINANCFKCHTVGANHNMEASNNGFDDIATSVGWAWSGHPGEGKWDTLKTFYPELVNHATIGCESCHGPGREHAYGGHVEKIAVTVDAGACGQCHDEPWRHNKFAQYENSLHAEAIWSSSFARANSDNSISGNCSRCHEGDGFVTFTKGKVFDGSGLTKSTHQGITCATCHDPHGNSNEFSLRDTPAGSDTLGNGFQYTTGGTGRLCMNCHKARRDNVSYTQSNVTSSHWGPHHSVQADVFFGQNAAQFDETPFNSGYHKFALANACVDCHMTATTDTGTVTRDRVGGHSFKLHDAENDYYHTTSCVPCHGELRIWDDFEASADYDIDGTVESVPQEIAGLETLLRTWLPPMGIDSIDYKQMDTPEKKKAYFNYQLIAYDGSGGMHNARFAIDVLSKSIEALGGTVGVEENEYSSPTQYTLIQNYPNPFNPSTKIKYNIPFDSHVKVTIYSITGEMVRILVDATTRAGLHEVEFNTFGANLSSGIYFYMIEANAVDRSTTFRETKKMVLLK
jgi:hypothetical protein